MGHLDLTHTALVLHVPAVRGHRYYSFRIPGSVHQRLSLRRNAHDRQRRRQLPDHRPRLQRHGTARASSGSARPMTSPGSSGARWSTAQSDLPAVHRVQNGYKLIPLAGFRARGLRWTPPRPAKIVTKPRHVALPTGVRFFDALGTALAQSPPPARDAPILRQAASGRHRVPDCIPRPSISARRPRRPGRGRAARGRARVRPADLHRRKSVVAHNGWFVPPPINGAYGTDYGYRAVVALNGLAANLPAEALYIVGVASGKGLLTGGHDYVIHFAAGHLPPARYFWSLTMYDENFYLVPNALEPLRAGQRHPGPEAQPRRLAGHLRRRTPTGRARLQLAAGARARHVRDHACGCTGRGRARSGDIRLPAHHRDELTPVRRGAAPRRRGAVGAGPDAAAVGRRCSWRCAMRTRSPQAIARLASGALR